MVTYQKEAISIDVGLRLKELREARNISMRALATKSGLSANALSMIERGKTSPSVSTLYKLADALGVSIPEFFHLCFKFAANRRLSPGVKWKFSFST